MSLKTSSCYEFGPFRLEREAKLLLRDGETVALTPKVFDLLWALVESRGSLVTKDALMARVWPDTFVEETNLTKGISVLRQTLGEGYIETLAKRGYRFTAEVSVPGEARAQPPRRSFVRVAAGLALLATAAGSWYALRPAPTRPFESLAVLPFVDLSKGGGQDYFSDGLTEEIINALTPIEGLKVVARTSSFRFRGKNVDIRSVGEQLGAEAVMEGSVRIEGNRLRVTTQLNNARDGYHYWSRTYDHEMKDVLAVQSDIAREVAQAMGRSVAVPAKALTENLQAYDLYLRGKYHSTQVGQFSQAMDALNDALKLDPKFAAAHAQIASAYIQHITLGGTDVERGLPLIREHLNQAMRLDPGLAAVQAVSAMTSFTLEWNFPAAEREYLRALELNPADAAVHSGYARFLTAMGRFDEAEDHAKRAQVLDPLGLFEMVWLYYYHGKNREALAAAQPALNANPNSPLLHVFVELAYTELGDYRKAVVEMAKHPFRKGVPPKALAGFERGGAKGFWQVMYDETLAAQGERVLGTYQLAQDSAQLGLTEVSLGWIEKSIARHDPLITYLAVDPPLKKLRGDARFRELVRRVGLPMSALRVQ